MYVCITSSDPEQRLHKFLNLCICSVLNLCICFLTNNLSDDFYTEAVNLTLEHAS